MTSRPLYCPQCGQTRCGTFGSWQFGHSACAGLLRASWARRFCVRALECLSFRIRHDFLFPYSSDFKCVNLSKPSIGRHRDGLAAAMRFVAVRAAHRADAFAVLAAHPLHRELQQQLLPHYVFQLEAGQLVKSHLRLALVDRHFLARLPPRSTGGRTDRTARRSETTPGRGSDRTRFRDSSAPCPGPEPRHRYAAAIPPRPRRSVAPSGRRPNPKNRSLRLPRFRKGNLADFHLLNTQQHGYRRGNIEL